MRPLTMIGAGLAAVFVIAGSSPAQADQPAPTPAKQATVRPNFVDDDGDGICDRCGSRQAAQARRRGGSGRCGCGPGDGSGNQGVGPRDGSGRGPGAAGGNCDGTGPKGRGRGAGRR
jgi:hypothetical protein